MNTSFYVSLDKNALYHNIEYLREYKQKELLPVIKANAYGHNYLLIAKALYDFNIKTWATARFSEAITITKYMINNFSINDFKILVFESLDDDYSFLEKYPQICPTINSIKDLKNALANNIPIDRLSLKIDLRINIIKFLKDSKVFVFLSSINSKIFYQIYLLITKITTAIKTTAIRILKIFLNNQIPINITIIAGKIFIKLSTDIGINYSLYNYFLLYLFFSETLPILHYQFH